MILCKALYLYPLLASMAIAQHTEELYGFRQRNLKTIQTIYNLTIYPNNLPIIQHGGSAVPSGLFDINATGRVTPVGNFTGFNDSIEYFFSIAPQPVAPLFGVFSDAQIVEFSSDCPEVASSVVYLHTSSFNPNSTSNGQQLAPLKQTAFWRFNEKGEVLFYDAWIPNLTRWTAALSGIPTNATTKQTAAYHDASIRALCSETQVRCVGNNAQYKTVEQCIDVLQGKPYGEGDEMWGDNIVCRAVHILLTFIRPEVHCPHVGPTGGMKCVDADYTESYFDDPPLFGAPEGKTFKCPNV